GKLLRSGKIGRVFTKTKAQAEHAARAQVEDGGELWYAPRRAARYTGVSPAALFKWQTACPWLDGQAVRTRPLPSGYNRTITYYAKESLDRIRDAKAARPLIPSYPDLVYIGDACRELRMSART